VISELFARFGGTEPGLACIRATLGALDLGGGLGSAFGGTEGTLALEGLNSRPRSPFGGSTSVEEFKDEGTPLGLAAGTPAAFGDSGRRRSSRRASHGHRYSLP